MTNETLNFKEESIIDENGRLKGFTEWSNNVISPFDVNDDNVEERFGSEIYTVNGIDLPVHFTPQEQMVIMDKFYDNGQKIHRMDLDNDFKKYKQELDNEVKMQDNYMKNNNDYYKIKGQISIDMIKDSTNGLIMIIKALKGLILGNN